MKNSVIAIQSCVITTIVYALLVPVFFEMDNAHGEGKSYALNILFQEYGSTDKNDLFVLSDGDVYVSNNVIMTQAN